MQPDSLIFEMRDALVSTYQPRHIYLFGSQAWGTPTEHSDYDFLVVVDSSDQKLHQRSISGQKALRPFRVPKDILVYTEKEFCDQMTHPSSLAFKIKNEGVSLYDA